MPKTSAGLLMFRTRNGALQVFLVHPGGPFWATKDEGAWSVPKGEHGADEDALAAARREFEEETGCPATGEFFPLAPQKQRSGKVITVWAFAGDCDPAALHSNHFWLEWPPRSGKHRQFPEVDRAAWFTVPEALRKLAPGQQGFVVELARMLARSPRASTPTAPSRTR